MEKKGFRAKLKDMLSFMCSRGEAASPLKATKNEESVKKAIRVKKDPRQTYSLTNQFFKLSRKNIVEEEFFSKEILNYQLEKHIGNRMKQCTTAVIKGEFSQEIHKRVVFPIEIVPNDCKIHHIGKEKIREKQVPMLKKGSIDLFLYQTYQTYSDYETEGSFKEGSLEEEELKEIKLALKRANQSHSNCIVLCSRDIQDSALNKILKECSEKGKRFLFEVEKVRQNQEVVCNVIYMGDPEFLRINDYSFRLFVIESLNPEPGQCAAVGSLVKKLMQGQFYYEIVETLQELKRNIDPHANIV